MFQPLLFNISLQCFIAFLHINVFANFTHLFNELKRGYKSLVHTYFKSTDTLYYSGPPGVSLHYLLINTCAVGYLHAITVRRSRHLHTVWLVMCVSWACFQSWFKSFLWITTHENGTLVFHINGLFRYERIFVNGQDMTVWYGTYFSTYRASRL